ncbi:MAG: 50S ribosomal protein L18 [candidate division WOR-3 bacterium]
MGEVERTKIRRQRRKLRVRSKIFGTSERPRLSVVRTNKHIYAQVIDDFKGHTLVQASTLDKEIREKLKGKTLKEKAKEIGIFLAERCKKENIEKVVFDKGRFAYHGCVKSLAEGAREGGLKF